MKHYTAVVPAIVLWIHQVGSFPLQPFLFTGLSIITVGNHHNNDVNYLHKERRRIMQSSSSPCSSSSTCKDLRSFSGSKRTRLKSTTNDEPMTSDVSDYVREDEEFLLHGVPSSSSSSWEEELIGEECPVDSPQCLLVMEMDTDELLVEKSSRSDSTNIPGVPIFNDDVTSISFLPYDEDASEMELIMDKFLRFVPFFLPVIAFSLYDPTAIAFASVVDFLASNNSWIAVDGGAYQAMIIAPVINGVVVASISLLFAIEIGLTISKLLQRKNDIQLCITMEASKLMILKNLLSDFPTKTQEKCNFYLLQYTSRLISECHETVNIALTDISQTDSELDGCMQELIKAAAADSSIGYCAMLVDQAMAAVESLSENRSKRISALQSTFPMLHYVLLATLASSICFAFLVETDQDILVFMNAIQLRLLWTMLVGTFSALGLVCYDLEHPFRGFYQISDTVKELYEVRLEYTE